jgi:hypothetical protein
MTGHPPHHTVSPEELRRVLAERDEHRRQRELVRASLVACPARVAAPPAEDRTA